MGPGWTVEARPSDVTIANAIGSCEGSFAARGDTLVVTRRLRVDHPHIGAKHYAAVQDLFRTDQGLAAAVVALARAPADPLGQ